LPECVKDQDEQEKNKYTMIREMEERIGKREAVIRYCYKEGIFRTGDLVNWSE
jgi:hypothetical protein